MAYIRKDDAKKEAVKAALDELKRRIKDGDTSGVYVFSGEEEYMKRHYFRELCRFAKDSVNVSVLQGEIEFGELCNELLSVPMQEFSLFDNIGENDEKKEKKRVIKLENPDFSKLSQRELAETYSLFEDCGKMSVVVIYLSNIDSKTSKANSEIIKKIKESALVCEFERAKQGDKALLSWIKRHFDKEKIIIEPYLVSYLSECVGTDMSMLSSEIEKLTAYLLFKGRNTLEKADIDYICVKNADAITFDVTNAITDGKFEEGINALSKLRALKTEPLLIFGAITKMAGDVSVVATSMASGKTPAQISTESGIRDFVVKKYVSFLSGKQKDYAKKFAKKCLLADEQLKNGADGYLVLEKLLFELI